MRKHISIVIVVFTNLIIAPALACSCILPSQRLSSHVKDAVKTTTVIASVEVLEVYTDASTDMQTANLLVIESWKGPHLSGNIIKSITLADSSSCGRSVENGEKLLVYLYNNEPYSIPNCSLTGRLESAEKQIKILNKLKRGKNT
jgi:hypothetical protein